MFTVIGYDKMHKYVYAYIYFFFVFFSFISRLVKVGLLHFSSNPLPPSSTSIASCCFLLLRPLPQLSFDWDPLPALYFYGFLLLPTSASPLPQLSFDWGPFWPSSSIAACCFLSTSIPLLQQSPLGGDSSK